MTVPPCAPLPPPPLTPAQHEAIRREAAAAHLVACTGVSQWAVACVSVQRGRHTMAALNVYPDLPAALVALGDLRAELAAQPHQEALLIPVGPLTEREQAAAGLLSDTAEEPPRA